MSSRTVNLRRDQRGIALPLALGIMFVLSISVAVIVTSTGANERSAKRVSAEERSFSLAEAGLTRAAAILYNGVDAMNANGVGSGSEALDGGTSAYSGVLSGQTWTLTGTGVVANPAAGGAAVTRTVTAQVSVSTLDSPWHYLFADSTTGCMTVKQNVTLSTPLYSRGNVCMLNNAHATGSPFEVEGTLSVSNNASVGYAATPIAVARLKGGCTGGAPDPHPCTSSDSVFASAIMTTTSGMTKPPVNLTYWYANAKPGPSSPCSVGSMPGGFDSNGSLDRSRADFDLTPGSSYDCRVTDGGGNVIGQLSWDSGTRILTIVGVIFFDGTVQVTNNNAVYQGRGTIYSSKVVTLGNDAKLCGVSGCTSAWEPLVNNLVFVAGSDTATYGFELQNNAVFQGGAYVVTDYHSGNNATNWGPVIARNIVIDNNSLQSEALGALPPGAPGMDTTLHRVSGSWRG